MLLSIKCPAYGVRDQGLPVIIWFDGHFELNIRRLNVSHEDIGEIPARMKEKVEERSANPDIAEDSRPE